MRLLYDLHTHSCLSPCGDPGMTPNNLVNMAYLKGLNMLAVCDHNAAHNLRAVAAVCEARGILHIPAIEAETREEAHILCYMPTVSAAEKMSDILQSALPDMPLDAAFFGEQTIMDEDDEPIGSIDRLLIQATMLSVDELFEACRGLGGVPVPAHINKQVNSIIYSLGFIPPNLNVKSVEMHLGTTAVPLGVKLEKFTVLRSTDAHNLESIAEGEAAASLELEEASVECVLALLRGER